MSTINTTTPPPPPEEPSTDVDTDVDTAFEKLTASDELHSGVKDDTNLVGGQEVTLRGQTLPEGSKVHSPPNSEVLAVETPADPDDPDSVPQTQLFFEDQPTNTTPGETGGVRYDFEDGSFLEVGVDGVAIHTTYDEDGNLVTTSYPGQNSSPPAVGSITFPSESDPDGGTTFSFYDPTVNQAVAASDYSTAEDRQQLFNLGLHRKSDGAPDPDILNSMFEREGGELAPETLKKILSEPGADQIYLELLAENDLNYKTSDLWDGDDAETTDLGEAIVQAGGVDEARRLGLVDEQNGELTDKGEQYLDLLDDYPELANDPEYAAALAENHDDGDYDRDDLQEMGLDQDPSPAETGGDGVPGDGVRGDGTGTDTGMPESVSESEFLLDVFGREDSEDDDPEGEIETGTMVQLRAKGLVEPDGAGGVQLTEQGRALYDAYQADPEGVKEQLASTDEAGNVVLNYDPADALMQNRLNSVANGDVESVDALIEQGLIEQDAAIGQWSTVPQTADEIQQQVDSGKPYAFEHGGNNYTVERDRENPESGTYKAYNAAGEVVDEYVQFPSDGNPETVAGYLEVGLAGETDAAGEPLLAEGDRLYLGAGTDGEFKTVVGRSDLGPGDEQILSDEGEIHASAAAQHNSAEQPVDAALQADALFDSEHNHVEQDGTNTAIYSQGLGRAAAAGGVTDLDTSGVLTTYGDGQSLTEEQAQQAIEDGVLTVDPETGNITGFDADALAARRSAQDMVSENGGEPLQPEQVRALPGLEPEQGDALVQEYDLDGNGLDENELFNALFDGALSGNSEDGFVYSSPAQQNAQQVLIPADEGGHNYGAPETIAETGLTAGLGGDEESAGRVIDAYSNGTTEGSPDGPMPALNEAELAQAFEDGTLYYDETGALQVNEEALTAREEALATEATKETQTDEQQAQAQQQRVIDEYGEEQAKAWGLMNEDGTLTSAGKAVDHTIRTADDGDPIQEALDKQLITGDAEEGYEATPRGVVVGDAGSHAEAEEQGLLNNDNPGWSVTPAGQAAADAGGVQEAVDVGTIAQVDGRYQLTSQGEAAALIREQDTSEPEEGVPPTLDATELSGATGEADVPGFDDAAATAVIEQFGKEGEIDEAGLTQAIEQGVIETDGAGNIVGYDPDALAASQAASGIVGKHNDPTNDTNAGKPELIAEELGRAGTVADGFNPQAVIDTYGNGATIDEAGLQEAIRDGVITSDPAGNDIVGYSHEILVQKPLVDALTALAESDDPRALSDMLDDVYGEAVDTAELEEKIRSGDWSWLPPPEMASDEELTYEGTVYDGAYAAAQENSPEDRIFINENRSVEEQQNIYMEEIGHFFDTELKGDAAGVGGDDSDGDEGQLFSAALSGALYGEDGVSVRAEAIDDKDHGQITLEDGTTLNVEFMEGTDTGTNQGDSVETLDDLEQKYPGVEAEFAQVPGSEPPVYHVLVKEPDGAPLDMTQIAAIRQDLDKFLKFWEVTTGNREGRVVFSNSEPELFSELQRPEPRHTAADFNNDDVPRPPSEIIQDLEHDLNALPPPALLPTKGGGMTTAKRAAARARNKAEMDRYNEKKQDLIDSYQPQVDQIMQNGTPAERQALARGLSDVPGDSFPKAENFAAVTGLEEIKNSLAKNSIDNLVASGIDPTTISNNLDDFAEGLLNPDRSGVKRLFPKTMMAHLLEVDRQGRVNNTGVGLSREPQDIKGDIQERLGFDRNAVIDQQIRVIENAEDFDAAANSNFSGVTKAGASDGWPSDPPTAEQEKYRNAWLVHNGQMYKTDHLGRVVEVRAEPIQTPSGRQGEGATNHTEQDIGRYREGGTKHKNPHAATNDVGFHILGDDLGGGVNRLNVVPGNGQDGGFYNLNTYDYKYQFEDMSRLLTGAGYDVSATFKIEYKDDTTRPSSIGLEYTYSKDGVTHPIGKDGNAKPVERKFDNQAEAGFTERQRRQYFSENLNILSDLMENDPNLAKKSGWATKAFDQYKQSKYAHFDSGEGGPRNKKKAADKDGSLIYESVGYVEPDDRFPGALSRFGKNLKEGGIPNFDFTLGSGKDKQTLKFDMSRFPEDYEAGVVRKIEEINTGEYIGDGSTDHEEGPESKRPKLVGGSSDEAWLESGKKETVTHANGSYEFYADNEGNRRKTVERDLDGNVLNETFYKDNEPATFVDYGKLDEDTLRAELGVGDDRPLKYDQYTKQTTYNIEPDGSYSKVGSVISHGDNPVQVMAFDPETERPLSKNEYDLDNFSLQTRTEYNADGSYRVGDFREIVYPLPPGAGGYQPPPDVVLQWDGTVTEYDTNGDPTSINTYDKGTKVSSQTPDGRPTFERVTNEQGTFEYETTYDEYGGYSRSEFKIEGEERVPQADYTVRSDGTANLFAALAGSDPDAALRIIQEQGDQIDPYAYRAAGENQNTLLHEAILKGWDDVALALFDLAPEALGVPDALPSARNTPLALAVKKGNTELTAAMFERLATLQQTNPALVADIVNAQDARGNTALHVAALHGNDSTLQSLIGLGADNTITNTYGKTAADYYAESISFQDLAFAPGVRPNTPDHAALTNLTNNPEYSDLRWFMANVASDTLDQFLSPELQAGLGRLPVTPDRNGAYLDLARLAFVQQRNEQGFNADLFADLGGDPAQLPPGSPPQRPQGDTLLSHAEINYIKDRLVTQQIALGIRDANERADLSAQPGGTLADLGIPDGAGRTAPIPVALPVVEDAPMEAEVVLDPAYSGTAPEIAAVVIGQLSNDPDDISYVSDQFSQMDPEDVAAVVEAVVVAAGGDASESGPTLLGQLRDAVTQSLRTVRNALGNAVQQVKDWVNRLLGNTTDTQTVSEVLHPAVLNEVANANGVNMAQLDTAPTDGVPDAVWVELPEDGFFDGEALVAQLPDQLVSTHEVVLGHRAAPEVQAVLDGSVTTHFAPAAIGGQESSGSYGPNFDGQATATFKTSNGGVELPSADPENNRPYVHYWIDEGGELWGRDQYDSTNPNDQDGWIRLGAAPDSLPRNTNMHVNQIHNILHIQINGKFMPIAKNSGGVWYPVDKNTGNLYASYVTDEDGKLWGVDKHITDIPESLESEAVFLGDSPIDTNGQAKIEHTLTNSIISMGERRFSEDMKRFNQFAELFPEDVLLNSDHVEANYVKGVSEEGVLTRWKLSAGDTTVTIDYMKDQQQRVRVETGPNGYPDAYTEVSYQNGVKKQSVSHEMGEKVSLSHFEGKDTITEYFKVQSDTPTGVEPPYRVRDNHDGSTVLTRQVTAEDLNGFGIDPNNPRFRDANISIKKDQDGKIVSQVIRNEAEQKIYERTHFGVNEFHATFYNDRGIVTDQSTGRVPDTIGRPFIGGKNGGKGRPAVVAKQQNEAQNAGADLIRTGFSDNPPEVLPPTHQNELANSSQTFQGERKDLTFYSGQPATSTYTREDGSQTVVKFDAETGLPLRIEEESFDEDGNKYTIETINDLENKNTTVIYRINDVPTSMEKTVNNVNGGYVEVVHFDEQGEKIPGQVTRKYNGGFTEFISFESDPNKPSHISQYNGDKLVKTVFYEGNEIDRIEYPKLGGNQDAEHRVTWEDLTPAQREIKFTIAENGTVTFDGVNSGVDQANLSEDQKVVKQFIEDKFGKGNEFDQVGVTAALDSLQASDYKHDGKVTIQSLGTHYNRVTSAAIQKSSIPEELNDVEVEFDPKTLDIRFTQNGAPLDDSSLKVLGRVLGNNFSEITNFVSEMGLGMFKGNIEDFVDIYNMARMPTSMPDDAMAKLPNRMSVFDEADQRLLRAAGLDAADHFSDMARGIYKSMKIAGVSTDNAMMMAKTVKGALKFMPVFTVGMLALDIGNGIAMLSEALSAEEKDWRQITAGALGLFGLDFLSVIFGKVDDSLEGEALSMAEEQYEHADFEGNGVNGIDLEDQARQDRSVLEYDLVYSFLTEFMSKEPDKHQGPDDYGLVEYFWKDGVKQPEVTYHWRASSTGERYLAPVLLNVSDYFSDGEVPSGLSYTELTSPNDPKDTGQDWEEKYKSFHANDDAPAKYYDVEEYGDYDYSQPGYDYAADRIAAGEPQKNAYKKYMTDENGFTSENGKWSWYPPLEEPTIGWNDKGTPYRNSNNPNFKGGWIYVKNASQFDSENRPKFNVHKQARDIDLAQQDENNLRYSEQVASQYALDLASSASENPLDFEQYLANQIESDKSKLLSTYNVEETASVNVEPEFTFIINEEGVSELVISNLRELYPQGYPMSSTPSEIEEKIPDWAYEDPNDVKNDKSFSKISDDLKWNNKVEVIYSGDTPVTLTVGEERFEVDHYYDDKVITGSDVYQIINGTWSKSNDYYDQDIGVLVIQNNNQQPTGRYYLNSTDGFILTGHKDNFVFDDTSFRFGRRPTSGTMDLYTFDVANEKWRKMSDVEYNEKSRTIVSKHSGDPMWYRNQNNQFQEITRTLTLGDGNTGHSIYFNGDNIVNDTHDVNHARDSDTGVYYINDQYYQLPSSSNSSRLKEVVVIDGTVYNPSDLASSQLPDGRSVKINRDGVVYFEVKSSDPFARFQEQTHYSYNKSTGVISSSLGDPGLPAFDYDAASHSVIIRKNNNSIDKPPSGWFSNNKVDDSTFTGWYRHQDDPLRKIVLVEGSWVEVSYHEHCAGKYSGANAKHYVKVGDQYYLYDKSSKEWDKTTRDKWLEARTEDDNDDDW